MRVKNQNATEDSSILRLKQLLEWLDDLNRNTTQAMQLIQTQENYPFVKYRYALDFSELYLYGYPPLNDLLRLSHLMHKSEKPTNALNKILWEDWFDTRMVRYFMVLTYLFEESQTLVFDIIPPYKKEMELKFRVIAKEQQISGLLTSTQKQIEGTLRQFFKDQNLIKIKESFHKTEDEDLRQELVGKVIEIVKNNYSTLKGIFGLTDLRGTQRLIEIMNDHDKFNFIFKEKNIINDICKHINENLVIRRAIAQGGIFEEFKNIPVRRERNYNNLTDSWGLEYVKEFNELAREAYGRGEAKDQYVMYLVSSSSYMMDISFRKTEAVRIWDSNSSKIISSQLPGLVLHPSSIFLMEVYNDNNIKYDAIKNLKDTISKIEGIKSYLEGKLKSREAHDYYKDIEIELELLLKQIRFQINLQTAAEIRKNLLGSEELQISESSRPSIKWIHEIVQLINEVLKVDASENIIKKFAENIEDEMNKASERILNLFVSRRFNTLPLDISYAYPCEKDNRAIDIEKALFSIKPIHSELMTNRITEFLKAWQRLQTFISREEHWEFPYLGSRVLKKIGNYQEAKELIDMARKLSSRIENEKDLAEKKIGFVEVMLLIRTGKLDDALSLNKILNNRYGADTTRFDLQKGYIIWNKFIQRVGGKLTGNIDEVSSTLLDDALSIPQKVIQKLQMRNMTRDEFSCFLIAVADICICYVFKHDLKHSKQRFNEFERLIAKEKDIDKTKLPLYIYCSTLVHLLEMLELKTNKDDLTIPFHQNWDSLRCQLIKDLENLRDLDVDNSSPNYEQLHSLKNEVFLEFKKTP